ncbi:outer membrane protein OmpK [Plesiomonas sp.]|uniref:nucleoside-specific channel-forming Tsx family protein n=1 Tax=Plesiomonas sp. TaxID=2486279 RepID=UPI003F2E2D7D
MRKSLVGLSALAVMASVSAHAEPIYSFANVSANYLDWSSRTTNESGKKDFPYLELEGGAGYNWGEVYGFFDLENPTHSYDREDGRSLRIAAKGTVRYYLGDSGFNLYGHFYDTHSDGFNEQNFIYGVGYNFNVGSFWAKPFLAANYTNNTFFDGNNGYMFGWVAGYDFVVADQKFSITNWNEYEFARDADYGNGGKEGLNGAVALWWNATPSITTGIQYRYADKKLGSAAYQDGLIYSVKYNF